MRFYSNKKLQLGSLEARSSMDSKAFNTNQKYNYNRNIDPYDGDKSQFSNLGSEILKTEKKNNRFGTRNSIDLVAGQLGSYSLFPSLEKSPSMNFY